MFTTVNCLVLILFINVVHINGATAPEPKPPGIPVEPKFGQCKLNKEDLESLITKGEKGVQGENGPAGPKGEQGPMGPPGICTCEANAVNTGTQDKPLKNVCKYEKDVIAEKEHFVKPEGIEAFKIHCENENKETCVLAAGEAKEFDNGETAFWLSSKKDWSIEKMYNLNLEQLDWLQRNSQTVTQTIRYHCLNTAPVPKDDANKSLKLLTWNGILIDAATSASSPLHYEVDDAEDHCKDYDPTKPTEWKYTDIKITTKLRGQLPIADLRINDVGKDKKFKIEHRKLCFQ